MIKLYNGIKSLMQKIIKIKNRYKSLVKIKNIVIKILNLGASGYSLFVMVEPLLEKNKEKSKIVDVK
jgi:hypothetical protein